jgi:membrane protease YdiL (CAAX protease family)
MARLIQIAAMVWIAKAMAGGIEIIGFARSQWARGLKKGVFWSAAFGAVALFAFVLLSLAGTNIPSMIRAPLPRGSRAIALLFLVGGIVAPVAEEIFFRGLLYSFFRRWGVALALVISTFLFVLPHSMSRGLPVTQIVGGLLFAVAYEVEGNLLVPITIHVLGNLAIFTLSAML